MNAKQFATLRSQAIELFNGQPARDKLKINLDAVFIALAGAAAFDEVRETLRDVATESGGKVRRVSEDKPPEWFTDTLEKLKGKGESVTVSRFLLLAGRFPATRSESLSVGRWLREAGYTPRKTGGNMLFDV